MKNLKKILCVVLVAAMMLGVVAVASAAKPAGSEVYDDYATIANKDAVDFLTELGVLNGFEDNNYHPEKNLTRAQMAKIVAYIVAQPNLTVNYNTVEDFLKGYAGTCTFKDVAATAWYAGPVGYDQYSGIVDGDDGISFRPEDNVSIVEAAKMCLVVLGYDADEAGLVGEDWIGNILTLGLKKGLFDGIDVTDINRDITRDEMAQMTYNALLATMVGYVETDDGLFEIDQVNDLSKIFGNNFNYWKNSDLFVGKQGVQYYFGKDIYTTTGIVIANEFANLGRIVDQGTDGEQTVSYKGLSVVYDPATEMVVYHEGGKCIGTGYCSGEHNEANDNCPATVDKTELFVAPIIDSDYECYEVIGRMVKLAALSNIHQIVTYDSLVVTADNSAEFVFDNGDVNTAADIDLADTTIEVGIFDCGEYGITNTVAFAVKGATYGWAAKNPAGYFHYNISNNNDATAEFSICVEEIFGQVTAISTTGVITVTDEDDAEYVLNAYIHGDTPAVGDYVLFFNGIGQNCTFVDVIEMNTGIINSYLGNALDDGNYNSIEIDEVDYVVSQLCTRDIRDNYVFSLNDTCEYWLDHGGNIVKFKLTDPKASVKALVYGIERTKDVFATTEPVTYTINTVQADGTEADYVITPDTMFGPGVARYIWDNSKAVYAEIEFARDDTVIAINRLTNVNDTTYTKATLVLGSEAFGTTKVTSATSVLFTDLPDVTGYVNDSTTFFNFAVGFGGYVMPNGETIDDTDISFETWNSLVAKAGVINKIGTVTITAGPATVSDDTIGSTFVTVDALTRNGMNGADAEIASVVVLPIVGPYSAMAPIANKAVDKTSLIYNTEFVYVNMDDISHATRVYTGTVDANGVEDVLYRIPCSGDREYITVTFPTQHFLAAFCGRTNGVLCAVTSLPGRLDDTVIPVVQFAGFAVGATVKADSDVMDRIALESVYADRSGTDGDELEADAYGFTWYQFGDYSINADYISMIMGKPGDDVWTGSYTDGSIIFSFDLKTGAVAEIAGDAINAGDHVLYIPVDAPITSSTTASAFADAISVAFVFPAIAD